MKKGVSLLCERMIKEKNGERMKREWFRFVIGAASVL